MVQLQKYPNTFLLVFFVSRQIIQNVLASTCATRRKHVLIHKYLYICLLFVCLKGKLVLLLDKTGFVSQETRPMFIGSQNFYFHSYNKLISIKAVHLSDTLSLTCPRVRFIEDICIGLFVLLHLLNRRHILEKVVSMQQIFEDFSEKQFKYVVEQ